MKITRQQVDRSLLERVRDAYLADNPSCIRSLARTSNNLYSFYLNRIRLAVLCEVLTPGDKKAGEYLREAARGAAAMFYFADPRNSGKEFRLNDDIRVDYADRPDESYLAHREWCMSMFASVVARQPDVLDILARAPIGHFRAPSTSIDSEIAYRVCEIELSFFRGEKAVDATLLGEVVEQGRSQPSAAAAKGFCSVVEPRLRLMLAIDRSDSEQFNICLADAVQKHKGFWTSTVSLKKDIAGYVSLPLTAYLTTAHCRGFVSAIYSDYLPSTWVNGEAFAGRG